MKLHDFLMEQTVANPVSAWIANRLLDIHYKRILRRRMLDQKLRFKRIKGGCDKRTWLVMTEDGERFFYQLKPKNPDTASLERINRFQARLYESGQLAPKVLDTFQIGPHMEGACYAYAGDRTLADTPERSEELLFVLGQRLRLAHIAGRKYLKTPEGQELRQELLDKQCLKKDGEYELGHTDFHLGNAVDTYIIDWDRLGLTKSAAETDIHRFVRALSYKKHLDRSHISEQDRPFICAFISGYEATEHPVTEKERTAIIGVMRQINWAGRYVEALHPYDSSTPVTPYIRDVLFRRMNYMPGVEN